MAKHRKVLVAVVQQTRRKQFITCALACGHTAVIRRQHRVIARTRCEACTAAAGALQDTRWVIPRPFCDCGCRERLPVGNRRFVSRAHWARFMVRQAPQLGGKGGKKAWSPGGKNYERYKQRLRARIEHIVPMRVMFTREEALLLVYRGRMDGYTKGFAAARMRHARVS